MHTLQSKSTNTIVMLTGLLVGLWVFVFHVVGFDLGYFPGDLGDGRLNLYFLEHAHKLFTGQLQSYWDAPFMYPEKNVLAYSDNLLGSAPIYSLFRLTGFSLYKAYQLWFIVISSLNYLAAFYFLNYVFKNNYAAVLGAFIFAFSIALQAQLAHAQMFPRFAIPLALLYAVKFDEQLNPKYFLFTILLVVYQIYCGIYLGFMLIVPIAIYLLFIFLKKLKSDRKILFDLKWLLKILFSVLICIAILMPLMLPYMERKISPYYEHYLMIKPTIPTIASYFYSPAGSLTWEFISQMRLGDFAWWDQQLFAGGIATVGLMVTVFIMLKQLVKYKFRFSALSLPLILMLTGIITLSLFLQIYDTSAYLIVYYIPGFSSMRSISRIINIELIFFGIAVAFIFSIITKKFVKQRAFLFMIALILLVCDNYVKYGKSYRTAVKSAEERVAKLNNVFLKIPSGAIVSYEPDKINEQAFHYQIDAMLAAQKLGLKTINAYTATCPGAYGEFWVKLDENSRNSWLKSTSVKIDSIYVVNSSNELSKVAIKEPL